MSTLNVRITHRYDTEENWNSKGDLIPEAGEFIFYETNENNPYPRLQIGDGATSIEELAISGGKISEEEIDEICN